MAGNSRFLWISSTLWLLYICFAVSNAIQRHKGPADEDKSIIVKKVRENLSLYDNEVPDIIDINIQSIIACIIFLA